jgi:hypothetical protein
MLLRFLVLIACAGTAPAMAADFMDVLSQPAVMSPLASKGLLQSVTRAGSKLVAVGQRGHIVVSSDEGKTWRQSPVPVSSDLTAVYFVNERKGWAVGHDGVILATATAAHRGDSSWTGCVPIRPWLPISRARPRHSLPPTRSGRCSRKRNAMSSKVRTSRSSTCGSRRDDGLCGRRVQPRVPHGRWRCDLGPWFDRTDNPKLLNLYSIRPAAGGLFIAGEAGSF